MEPPVYDDNEPPYVYIKKMEEYDRSLRREPYTHIKTFINKLGEGYEKKYNSLTEFKNISYLSDHTYNKKTLKTLGPKIAKSLKIEYDFSDLDNESIYEFINVMAKTIYYSLVKKTIGTKIYYSLLNSSNKSAIYHIATRN